MNYNSEATKNEKFLNFFLNIPDTNFTEDIEGILSNVFELLTSTAHIDLMKLKKRSGTNQIDEIK